MVLWKTTHEHRNVHKLELSHKAHNCKIINDEWITHRRTVYYIDIHYVTYESKYCLEDLPNQLYASVQIFLKQQHQIMLSSASSLVRLVYCYTRMDKVGGIWGTAQYHSRKNSLQLQPQQLQYHHTCFMSSCVYIVSKECSRCFMGSHEVKSQRRYQVFMMKMCWKLGLSLFGCGHQSCPDCTGASGKNFLFMWFSSQTGKETLNWKKKLKAKCVQISAYVSLIC